MEMCLNWQYELNNRMFSLIIYKWELLGVGRYNTNNLLFGTEQDTWLELCSAGS